jgi:hypothetical protein
MSDSQPSSRRALRGVIRPVVGYFDHRFQDLHDHLDAQPALDRLTAAMHERFDHLRADLQQTRQDVAADADTIAELAFTLERFADLFTARMEELAAALRPAEPAASTSVVALPFAFAAAGALEPGAAVATVDADPQLAAGLAALGLQVTALGRAAHSERHPDVAVVDDTVETWAGPGAPLDAIFLLPTSNGPRREQLDRCHKLLAPGGFLVTALALENGPVSKQVKARLADWRIERREVFAPVTGSDGAGTRGTWRRDDADAPQATPGAVAFVRAAPRA